MSITKFLKKITSCFFFQRCKEKKFLTLIITHLDSLLAGDGVSVSAAVAAAALEPLRPLPRPAPPTRPSEVGSRPFRPRPRAGFVGSLNLEIKKKNPITHITSSKN